jgi:hypothetical protein
MDKNIDELQELKEKLQGFNTEYSNELKKTFFNKFFPDIIDEDIHKYIVIIPAEVEKNLDRSQDWIVFSEHADDIFAYDNTQEAFNNELFKIEMESGNE